MRPDKIAMVNEIRSWVTGASYLILTNYKGMKVGQIKELRLRLAKQNSAFHVVKNNFFMKAVADMPGMKMAEPPDIPLAIVFGSGDGISIAKLIDDFAQEHKVAAIAGGFLDGRRFSAAEFAQLVKLPSKLELLGMLAGGLAAPVRGLVSVMRQKMASVVYALRAVQELKSKSSNK